MESCKLEIVVHSGKGLTDVKHFGTMDPYILVWLTGEYEMSPVYRTQTAIKGATCPVWNFRVKFIIASRSGENVSYPVKTSSGEIGGKIILSHTISFGENVIDMKTIEPENEGQSAMDVIKEMATEVAKEAREELLSVFS
ncbi:calcium-dependent lipid-binding family protein [Tanacetum coccineum]